MTLSRLRSCLLASSIVALFPTLAHAQMGGKIEELGSGGRSFNDAKPDLAHDPVNDVYAHVFEGGVQPHSIRLKLFDAKTRSGIPGGDIAMSTSAGNNINPTVAYIAKSGLFLVAWQDDAAGNWDVFCRAYDPTTKTAGPIVTVAATAADEITPDLAGDGTKSDDDAVLVWDDEAVGILGAIVEAQSITTVQVLSQKTLVAGASPANNNPAVSRSGGASRNIALVWEESATAFSVTSYTMGLVAASTPLSFPLTNSFPEVDGNGSEFLIVFQRPQPGTPTLGDIWCASVKIPVVPALPMDQVKAPRALAANPNDEQHPTVAFVGGSYLAAWAVTNTGDQFGNCQIQTVLPDCSTCGAGWLIQFGGRQRTVAWQAIASEYNSDVTTNARRARAIYDSGWIRNGAPASLLQKVNYEVAGGGTTNVAAGCGAGGALTIPQPFAFGEVFSATLTGAAPSATNSLFIVGLPSARTQFPCASCNILLGPFIFGVPLNGGQATWGGRIPCDIALNNLELDTQYVVFTPSTSPCPAILPGLSTSNILRSIIQ